MEIVADGSYATNIFLLARWEDCRHVLHARLQHCNLIAFTQH